jgi:hypothetical protein
MDTDKVVEQADVNPPESAPAPSPPVSEAPVKEPEEKKHPEGYVPHGAFHAERMTRRKLERDLAEERMKWETANKRLEEIAKKFTPAEKPIDPNEDPVGGIIHETKQTREEVAQLRKEREEEKKAGEQERRQRAFVERFDRDARVFASKTPDFTAAQTHLFQDYVSEAMEAGATQEEAHQEAWRQWHVVVNRAFELEESPAERLYKLAKRRGYKGSSEDKIETISNGSKATSPLASASGKAPSKLTAEVIAAMNQEDFDKLSEADFRRVFGG